ncbi:hypothetical protein ANN_10594 [Periplaneta americana]|uniref:Per a allergen n=1 Tax=Periplaneta americana TaxID=6978 RepID=A0ABQ8TRR4_PERAM|nr:hypothetical protein ANN_10594 [Periplaneta americana]
MAGLCEGGNEPPRSLKASTCLAKQSWPVANLNAATDDFRGALENFEGEAEIGRNLLGTTYARGAETDQLITERGEEELAGVCR